MFENGHCDMLLRLFVELHSRFMRFQEIQILRTDDGTAVVVAVKRNSHHDMLKSLLLVLLLRQMKVLADCILTEVE